MVAVTATVALISLIHKLKTFNEFFSQASSDSLWPVLQSRKSRPDNNQGLVEFLYFKIKVDVVSWGDPYQEKPGLVGK